MNVEGEKAFAIKAKIYKKVGKWKRVVTSDLASNRDEENSLNLHVFVYMLCFYFHVTKEKFICKAFLIICFNFPLIS